MIDDTTGYRRRCDVGGCGRPAVSLTPAPWDLAWCTVHDDLLHASNAEHFRWSMTMFEQLEP